MTIRADQNLCEPLSNALAWGSWAFAGRTAATRAFADVLMSDFGAIQMSTNAMGVAGQNGAQMIGPGPNGFFAINPGDRLVGGTYFWINSRTGNGAAYVQINYFNAALAFLSAITGNPLFATGYGRSTVDHIAPANAVWCSFNIIATEGAPNPPSSTINAFVAQPQFYVNVGPLPPYKPPIGLGQNYDVRLGPLTFTWPSGTLEETLGDTVDAVGAVLTPGDRRPRPIKIPVRIEGAGGEVLPAAAGKALRRQVRQLLENGDWLQEGLYLWLRADDEVGGWVRVGGGTISESDPGTAFGIYDLELEQPYLVGRPATHRPGRRLDLADRRTGLVPRDTRGTIYSTDNAAYAIPTQPLILPGWMSSPRSTVKRVGGVSGNTAAGPLVAGRRLYHNTFGVDGEVVTYSADDGALPHFPSAYARLDEPGSVRAWDMTGGTDPAVAGNSQGDIYPDALYGWERVLGAQLRSSRIPLALDNGQVRLVFHSDPNFDNVAFEWWDATIGRYRREGFIRPEAPQFAVYDVTILELTTERAVVSWRAGGVEMRIILQRGWRSCRVESYSDEATNAVIYYLNNGAFTSVTAPAPTWVKLINTGGREVKYALGLTTDTFTVSGAAFVYSYRAFAVVAQIGTPACFPDEVARLSLVDARSVPVVVAA